MQRPIRHFAAVLLAVAAAAAAGATQAQGLRPSGAFLQAGSGDDKVQVAGIGVLWPWSWRRATAGGGEWTGQTQLSLADLRVDGFHGERQHITQVALVPLLRYRPDAGQSRWFVEGGIGVSYMDRLLVTPDKVMSTRWNFSDNLAIGRDFGDQAQHEISLRLQHTSNAGIRHPNPGLNLWMVRYAARF